MAEEEEDFTVTMRRATRQIHNLSDTLVNAKLGIAMSNDMIWAEGLLVFYEVFRALENAMKRLGKSYEKDYFKSFVNVLLDSGLGRTGAFEADLEYYYGVNWRVDQGVPRPAVQAYLDHLSKLEAEDPIRLLAYIYHLYMGLFSGGQILKKKREFKEKMTQKAKNMLGVWVRDEPLGEMRGNAVVDFSSALEDGRSIKDVKKEIAFTMNEISKELSPEEKTAILEESSIVFQMNNEIVHSIENTGVIALKNLATNPLLIAPILIISILLMLFFK